MTRSVLGLLFFVAVAAAAVGDPCVQKIDCGVQAYEQCCQYQQGNVSACIDTRYQKCCPNTHCFLYASCCNNTCCSGRQSCFASETVEGSRDVCSALETMTPGQTFMSIIFPIILGVAALICYIFACLMIYIYKVRFTFPAMAVAAVSVVVFIVSFCLILSPHALQALFICAVAALALASLSATSDALAPTHILTVSVLATTVAFLLIINPLASNAVLSFSPNYPSVTADVAADRGQGGVLGSLLSALTPAALVAANSDDGAVGFTSCPSYYLGYWRRDPVLYTDTRIHDPAVHAEPYGLCGRSYLLWNAICATILAGALPVLVLALVARLLEVRGVAAAWPIGASVVHTHSPSKVHPRANSPHDTAAHSPVHHTIVHSADI